MGKFAEIMKKDYIKQNSKNLLNIIVQNLSDKQAALRQEIINTLDKFLAIIGAEQIIGVCFNSLSSESPELRFEVLKWIAKNQEFIWSN